MKVSFFVIITLYFEIIKNKATLGKIHFSFAMANKINLLTYDITVIIFLTVVEENISFNSYQNVNYAT